MNLIRRNFIQFIRLNYRSLHSFGFHDVESDILAAREKKLTDFYRDLFELNEKDLKKFLQRNSQLLRRTVDLNQLTQSFNFLQRVNFTKSTILQTPEVLVFSETKLTESMKLLEECCFQNIHITFLVNLRSTLETKIRRFKSNQIIAEEANISENLLKQLDISLVISQKLTDELTLSDVRKVIAKKYLEEKLGLKSPALDKASKGMRINQRSIKSLVTAVDMFQNQLGFSSKDIIEKHLLRACPRNLQRIFEEIPSIGGQPIQKILKKEPSLASKDVNDIKAKIKHLQNFGFTDEKIIAFPKILMLDKTTLYKCLVQIKKIEEFKALSSDPLALRLVFTQQRSAARINYLSSLALKSVSFPRLRAKQRVFEKYIRDGYDPSKGRDLITYVSSLFNKDPKDIKKLLQRHPYWREIPIVDVTATLNYLRYKQFSDEEISENIYLLLYPSSQIELKLQPLLEKIPAPDDDDDGDSYQCNLSKSRLLNLCLYQIELDYHFSGDGIWSASRKQNHIKAEPVDCGDAWRQQKAVNSLSKLSIY